MDAIDPIRYARTRNYSDGAISYLSPYLSRGVISTKLVMDHLRGKGYAFSEVEKFIQELAWRDYWQQVWLAKGNDINEDLKQAQGDVLHHLLPETIIKAQTGIEAVDLAIRSFYQTGYLHNHMRMYIAAIACNMGKSHWRTPAQWMYYHLLDGDWASNALSWQWVAGSNANKKYVANQDNINRYFHSQQKGSFLDVPYEAFDDFPCPPELETTIRPDLTSQLPQTESLRIEAELPCLLYTYYNLDPLWKQGEQANRILILEPSVFEQYPVSTACLDFAINLGKNIEDLQIYVGEFEEFISSYNPSSIVYKEHPLNQHFIGQKESRDWMFSVKGYFPSFFGFWKRCKKELKSW